MLQRRLQLLMNEATPVVPFVPCPKPRIRGFHDRAFYTMPRALHPVAAILKKSTALKMLFIDKGQYVKKHRILCNNGPYSRFGHGDERYGLEMARASCPQKRRAAQLWAALLFGAALRPPRY